MKHTRESAITSFGAAILGLMAVFVLALREPQVCLSLNRLQTVLTAAIFSILFETAPNFQKQTTSGFIQAKGLNAQTLDEAANLVWYHEPEIAAHIKIPEFQCGDQAESKKDKRILGGLFESKVGPNDYLEPPEKQRDLVNSDPLAARFANRWPWFLHPDGRP